MDNVDVKDLEESLKKICFDDDKLSVQGGIAMVLFAISLYWGLTFLKEKKCEKTKD